MDQPWQPQHTDTLWIHNNTSKSHCDVGRILLTTRQKRAMVFLTLHFLRVSEIVALQYKDLVWLQQPLYSPETKHGSVVWSGCPDIWIEAATQQRQILFVAWASDWLDAYTVRELLVCSEWKGVDVKNQSKHNWEWRWLHAALLIQPFLTHASNTPWKKTWKMLKTTLSHIIYFSHTNFFLLSHRGKLKSKEGLQRPHYGFSDCWWVQIEPLYSGSYVGWGWVAPSWP